MTDILSRILRANEAYARGRAQPPSPPDRPSLRLAIVTCMDGRINVNEALGLADGEAHIIRTAGGVVTDDVLRSLVVSQWALATEEIMVIQHSGCGMLRLDDDALRARILQETGADIPFELGGFPELEGSVRASVQRLRECKILRVREHVSGFVLDLQSKLLQPVS